MVIMCCLLFGTAKAFLAAADDLAYLVGRLRAVWPCVDIEFRADSGFAAPEMFDMCEQLGLWYTIGYGMNPVLKAKSDALLEEVVAAYDKTGEPQREFIYVDDYRSQSWRNVRLTILKCEATKQGTNRRAVVTNRSRGRISPQGIYDEYVDRVESENRNKELKCGLHTDRLSDHRYMANLFRLYMHVESHTLLVRLRNEIAKPEWNPEQELPADALPKPARKRQANRRRREDPLGAGHPATWRTLVIKVAAEVVERARHIRVQLSSSWPWLDHFRAMVEAVSKRLAVARE